MKKEKEIPVYMFLGFLESGKTTFVQEALEGPDFLEGQRTLLLVCEEGETAYEKEKFFEPDVFVETVESEEDLTQVFLRELTKKYKPTQVMVEYNGMWQTDTFSEAMPPEWIVYQILMVADARTFQAYNRNMRNLTFDKMSMAEMIIFNRFSDKMSKQDFHKIVRVANSKAEIIYEFGPNRFELDDIKDPLPYDIDAPVINITELQYAVWYRDINEETEKYVGKTVHVKGRCLTGGGLPKDAFIFGRHVMSCCVDDIQFAGLVAKWPDSMSKIEHGGWYNVTGVVSVEFHPTYGESGPVIQVKEITKAAPPVEEVATF
ncbi:MAG: hypothetical protein K6F52_05825 [Clostridia bacterium]|nr:hypothetical protein [Clostridia bacterium]